MGEQDFNEEEFPEENVEDIPYKNKRRPTGDEEKTAYEIELEKKLETETVRREAAEAKLVGVQAKFEELKTQMERETQEMRGRMQKALEDRAKQAQFNFLTMLLPVLDNLNLAIEHAEKDSSLEHLLEGVKGTARSFDSALSSVGVEPVESIGMNFDPELHEAVDMTATDAENDGKITAVYSHGYKFGDRLLRPARVQVGKGLVQKAGE
jgi:molecular chaperone GrpE